MTSIFMLRLIERKRSKTIKPFDIDFITKEVLKSIYKL